MSTTIKQAIDENNFSLLGSTAESNALAMHATMQSARPSIMYSLPETIATMHKVWMLREQGHEIYFTQDAGANLKLLFLEEDNETVKNNFEQCEIIAPFG